MKGNRTYKIADVARIAGVTVRTLHHYDQLGLLKPTERSLNGYRLYNDESLLRLQQILVERALGLSLEEIRRSLDDPAFDRRATLLRQRRLLREQAHDIAGMMRGIDNALDYLEQEETNMDMKELFNGFDPAEYEDEAKTRWGDGDAFKESARRTKRYTAEDWKALAEEQDEIYRDALAVIQAGGSPEDPEALKIAERHRQSIDRWFYPCSHAMHAGLADLFEADARFAANIDKHGDGLTKFLTEAIRANAQNKRE